MVTAHFLAVVLILSLSLLSGITHLPLQVPARTTKGFSTDLIHRDSPGSPYHDPTSTPSSRLRAAFRRSSTRAAYFRHVNFPNSISQLPIAMWSPLTNDDFEFLMSFHIGSIEIFAIVDTGSSLLWVLCYRCPKCFKHKHIIFRERYSKNHKKILCKSDPCLSLGELASCNDGDLYCNFNIKYADGSSVNGLLSSDTLTFHNVDLPGIIFGCTHGTNGSFNENSIGIVGLGNEEFSLVRQLNSSFGSKFSYCLPFKNTNKINFGSAAEVSGPRAVTTPLYYDMHFYRLNLVAISVKGAEGKPITVKPSPPPQGGNMIIDTGIAHTFIDEEANRKLKEVLQALIPLPTVNFDPPNYTSPIRSVLNTEYELCFNISSAPRDIPLPSITFHFAGHASVILGRRQTFIFLKDMMVICLTILSSDQDGGISTFGAYAQSGFLIGYNLHTYKLTFLPKEC